MYVKYRQSLPGLEKCGGGPDRYEEKLVRNDMKYAFKLLPGRSESTDLRDWLGIQKNRGREGYKTLSCLGFLWFVFVLGLFGQPAIWDSASRDWAVCTRAATWPGANVSVVVSVSTPASTAQVMASTA